jgi:hypothetical protein
MHISQTASARFRYSGMAKLGLVTLGCALPLTAFARQPQESFVELQAARYTVTRTTLEDKRPSGSTDKNKLSQNAFLTFPNRVTFAGRADSFAILLTRSFNNAGSSYVALGYVFSEMLEVGLGLNVYNATTDKLTPTNSKFKEKEAGIFAGPYVLVNVPTDLAELEFRWEVDYGTSKREEANIETMDAKGFETDFDARFVFRLSNHLSLTSGANVYYKAVEDKAPSGSFLDGAGKKSFYANSKRSDLVLGVNLLGARFSF